MIDVKNLNAVINTITQALTPMAEKIGQSGVYLMQVYTKQAFLSGVSGLINILLSSCILIVLGVVIKKCIKRLIEGSLSRGSRTTYSMITAVSIAVMLIFTVGIFNALPDCVSNLFNPQYTAIHQIFSDVTGRK